MCKGWPVVGDVAPTKIYGLILDIRLHESNLLRIF